MPLGLDDDEPGNRRWCLYSFVRSNASEAVSPESTMSVIRDMSANEVQEARSAVKAVSSLQAAAQVTPFEKATRSVLHTLEESLSTSVDWVFNPASAVEPNLALDQWLSQAVVARKRMVRDIRGGLGPAAGKWLKAALRHLYEADAEYRFVYEWRNVSQHQAPPLELTQTRQELGKPTFWTISPHALGRYKPRSGAWPQSVIELADNQPELRTIIRGVWEKTANAYAGCLLAHEEEVKEDLELLAGLLREGQSELPGGRVIALWPDVLHPAEGADVSLPGWTPISLSALEALARDLDTARARLNVVA